MKKEVKNLEASIKAQLLNKARGMSRPFSEVLKYYGMERFLYRFSQSNHVDRFILKGALMFSVWNVPERRATLDLDFSANHDNRIDIIKKIIKDVCEIKVIPDGLVFDPESVIGQRIKEAADYEGIRVKFLGQLERSRIPMQIDIGFGDRIYPKPKVIEYPVILDLPKPKMKGYPVESVVSEKFEAIVKLGLLNSRMKDFYDIWLLKCQFDFKGSNLSEAIKRTFTSRRTDIPKKRPLFAEEIYDEKSDRQILWKAFLKKGDMKNVPEKLASVTLEIEDFLVKPISAIGKAEKFNKFWKAPGPWK